MTQEEYKELKTKFCKATEILNDIEGAKRELRHYITYKNNILNDIDVRDLKIFIPEEEVDKMLEDTRNKIIRNLKASITNLEREFEEL